MSTPLATSSNIAEIAASLRGGATLDGEVTTGSDEALASENEFSVTTAESIDDSGILGLQDGEDNTEDSLSGSAKATDSKQNESKDETSSGLESITVTDDKGKRKIQIDWNNKDKLKQYVQMAHGARKWQKERDDAIKTTKELQEKYSSLSSNWDSLEQAYQAKGIEGLVNLLEGSDTAFSEWEKTRIDRYNFLQKATPAQRDLFEAQEKEAARSSELERLRKEHEEYKNSIAAEKEAAELASLEGTIHPVFDRYRFADKLGDADTEAMFDEMLWNNTLRRLESYEEKGVPLTASLVEREFKEVATKVRQRINSQAEKKAAKTVEKKKREATENAQVAVSAGYRPSSLKDEALNLAKSGDLGGILKNWNKYSKAFK